MDQYCVVVCGLRAGASDEASAWAPVAVALRMEPADFARRVVAALPRIVRRQLDRATAERIAQLLQGMHVDARALPDDAQLAYIDRDGHSHGPLPRSALGAFIEPGEAYRLHGSLAWEAWPEPPEHESSTVPAQAFDEAAVAPADEPIAEAPMEPASGEPEAPSTDTPSLPPPLPTAPSPVEATVPDDGAPTSGDEPAFDDTLINPPHDDPAPSADAAVEAPAEAGPPRRSRFGRLLALLVIVGVAAWAYQHWMAGTRTGNSAPPAPASHAPHSTDGAATAPATSVAAAPALAASTAAAGASSTPAPAASAPAPGSTAALPAAATTAPATASSAAPASAATAPPAGAASTAASPAAAGSSSPR